MRMYAVHAAKQVAKMSIKRRLVIDLDLRTFQHFHSRSTFNMIRKALTHIAWMTLLAALVAGDASRACITASETVQSPESDAYHFATTPSKIASDWVLINASSTGVLEISIVSTNGTSAEALWRCDCCITLAMQKCQQPDKEKEGHADAHGDTIATAVQTLLTVNTVDLEALLPGCYQLSFSCSNPSCQASTPGYNFVLNEAQSRGDLPSSREDVKGSGSCDSGTRSCIGAGQSAARTCVQTLHVELALHGQQLQIAPIVPENMLGGGDEIAGTSSAASELQPMAAIGTTQAAHDGGCTQMHTGPPLHVSGSAAYRWLLRGLCTAMSVLLMSRRAQVCVHKVGCQKA